MTLLQSASTFLRLPACQSLTRTATQFMPARQKGGGMLAFHPPFLTSQPRRSSAGVSDRQAGNRKKVAELHRNIQNAPHSGCFCVIRP